MPLKVKVSEKETGVFNVFAVGSIDTETSRDLDKAIATILKPSTKVIILDMEGVEYISSMGLGVIFKTKKVIEGNNGTLVLTSLKPNVRRVFETVKAIPSYVFENMEEADEHLDEILTRLQKKDE